MRFAIALSLLATITLFARPAHAAPARVPTLKLCLGPGGTINIRQRCTKTETTANLAGLRPVSVKGDQGAQGPQGPQGAPGLMGPIGPQGPEGAPGAPGLMGPQGLQGATGVQGAKGDSGLNGADGLNGVFDTSLCYSRTTSSSSSFSATASCLNPSGEFMLNWGIEPSFTFSSELVLNRAEIQRTGNTPTGINVRMMTLDGSVEYFTVRIICCPG
ncbi:MAG: hypothetical protein RIS36_2148 [Pseudomonadota bacterium]|jgi:hypothetical protein